jgi:hypothetical protein
MSKATKRYLELRRREMWLQLFSEGLDAFTDIEIKAEVLHGREQISSETTAEKFTEWVCQAMDRLDALVADKETRSNVMLCCSNRFPIEHIKRLKEELDLTGDLDALLEFMHTDESWHGLSFYEYPERIGNVIYVTKIPFDPKQFSSTNDVAEKRTCYCHCPHIRPAIRHLEPLSSTFCLCGSGFYKTLWEAILNQPIHVEVLNTVARGADRCRFAIYLPTEAQQPSKRQLLSEDHKLTKDPCHAPTHDSI